MSHFRETHLWKRAFVEPRADATVDEQAAFRIHLEAARKRAKSLVARIAPDMPGYTVHDISHLDALWETAALVASPGLDFNPPEAFVFGCAVLLHDAGMTLAAFPGGLSELKTTKAWQDTIALEGYPATKKHGSPSAPPPDIELKVKTEVLRRLHASKAAELATQAWGEASDNPSNSGSLHLIESTDLRRFYGPFIGTLAHSHWWPISRVENELDRFLGPMSPETRLSVDLLKIACLLRVSDAIHLDRRRAPHFIRALERPIGVSGEHWTFQEKFAFPRVENGALIFTAGEPFHISEANAWWQAFDALVIADRELRDADLLLRDRGRSGLTAQRVKGAGDPHGLVDYLPVLNWRPVETRVSVSDIPKIVQTFGGSQLYGSEPYVPIRELLQNAIDAVEARRLLQNRASSWGSVRCELQERGGTVWLSVEDTGVGMSERVLTGVLLDFGSSLWRSAKIVDEFPGLAASGMQAIGRFGVGFFSVFMLGDEVNVITRRFEKGEGEALRLEFRQGLASRPILSQAASGTAPIDGGTRVEVKLAKDPRGKTLNFKTKDDSRTAMDYLIRPPVFDTLTDLIGWLAPASAVAIETDHFGRKAVAVQANDWTSISVEEFADRLHYTAHDRRHLEAFLTVLRSEEGTEYGRGALTPQGYYWGEGGTFVVGGLRSEPASYFLGLLVGEATTAARNRAQAIVPAAALASWSSEQAKLMEASSLSDYLKAHCAELVLQCGGDIGNLPLVRKGEAWLNLSQLERHLTQISELRYHIGPIEYDEDDDPVLKSEFEEDFNLSDQLFIVPKIPDSFAAQIGMQVKQPSQIVNCMTLIAERLWGSVAPAFSIEIVVGTVGYEDIVRDIVLIKRAQPRKD